MQLSLFKINEIPLLLRRIPNWLIVFFLFLASFQGFSQAPCSFINFSYVNYEPCCYRINVNNSSECYPFLRIILSEGSFEGWGASTSTGWTGEQISPTEILLTHNSGHVPIGASTPIGFCLPPGVSPQLTILWDAVCGLGEGCFTETHLEGCQDPSDGSITGTVYRECNQNTFSTQPVLPDWPISLLDAMGIVLAVDQTANDGSYAFYDLPAGQYTVKAATQTGWTPNIPASGQSIVSLTPSAQVNRNFGFCPTCSCDDLYTDIVALENTNDTCEYNLILQNTGATCFNHLTIAVSSGQITNWEITQAGWTVVPINAQSIRLNPPAGYVPLGAAYPIRVGVTGSAEFEMTVRSYYITGGSEVICTRPFTQFCPLPKFPPCCPSGSIPGPELVTDGNFTNFVQNVTFTSLYPFFTPGGPTSIGRYSVLQGNQVYAANTQWACTGKSGSATDKFLVVDGSISNPLNVAWRQTVNVVSGQQYAFTAWANNLVVPSKNYDDPTVELWINNVLSGSMTLPETPDKWQQICATWVATTTGPVNIEIRAGTQNTIGNDFAVDCISFRTCSASTTVCTADFNFSKISCGKYLFNGFANGVPGYTYLWNFGDPNSGANNASSLQNPMHQFSGSGTYTVTLVITDATGCTATYSANLTIPVFPTVTITASAGLTICQGQSTTLTASGGNGNTYFWSSSQATQSITVNTPGIYCVTCTDPNGCTTSTCVTVQVQCCLCPAGSTQGPELVVNGDFGSGNTGFTSSYSILNPICAPGTYTVANSISVVGMCNNWACTDHTTGATTGQFFVADGSQTIGQAAWREQFTLTGSTRYAFCAYVNNLNEPNFDRADPIVEVYLVDGSNVPTLLTTVTLPESPDTWININALWNSPVAINNPYKLEFRTASTSFEGNNFAIDDISFRSCGATPPCTADFNFMNNGCGKISFNGFANGTPGYTYLWNFGDPNSGANNASSLQNPMHQFSAGGTYTVSLVITDATGCTATYSATVTVPAFPTVTITASAGLTICQGQSTTLTASGGNGNTYLWNTSQATQSITVSTPGVYCVTCTSANGCTTSTCVTVKVQCCLCPTGSTQGPELVVNGDFESGNTGFTSSYSILNPSCSPGTYNVANSSSVVGLCNNWACTDHTTGATTGQFFVADGSQTIGQAAWREQFTLTGSTRYAFCAYVNNLNEPNFDRADPIVEVYLVDGGGIPTLLTTVTLPESPDTWININALWNSPVAINNPYKLEFRTASTSFEGNNFAIDDISFRSCGPTPSCTADFNFMNNGCGKISFNGFANGTPGYTYLWNFGDPNSGANNASSLQNPMHQFSAGGTYTVSLVITDATSCTATYSATVTVPAFPTVTITANAGLTICQGQSTTLTASGGNGNTYLWNTSQATQSITVNTAGVYCVTCTSPNGCTTSTCVTVKVQCCLCPTGSTQGSELVVNGDFESGNTGFTSSYSILNPSCSPGTYNVANSSSVVGLCNNWACTDHTTGASTGQFFVADGSQTIGQAAWREFVTIAPSTQYAFCAYINNLNEPNFDRADPIIQVWLVDASGNQTMLTSATLPNTLPESPDTWVNINALWTSPASVSNQYKLEFRTASISFEGNNFAIDDISFRSCGPATPCAADFSINFIDNCGHVQLVNTSAGTAPIVLQWSNGNSAPSEDLFLPCGTYTYCLSITDATGCMSSICKTFTVVETVPPTIVCPQNASVNTNTGVCYYTGALPQPTGTDNCDQNLEFVCSLLTSSVSILITPQTEFPKGVNVITCYAIDDCGNNSGNCFYTLTVEDHELPVISCPKGTAVTGTIDATGQCKAIVNNIGANATDNCPMLGVNWKLSGATIGQGIGDASGTNFMSGLTTVTYTALDMAGNSATCSTTVIVQCDSCACGTLASQNLVVNGNFQLGDIGFGSDLTQNNICGGGTYDVVSDFNAFCGWPNLLDHTFNSANGLYLAIDGDENQAAILWESPVSLTNGASYCFSFWWASAYPIGQQSFPVSIDILDNAGAVLANIGSEQIMANTAYWTNTNTNWLSTLSGNYRVAIRQLSGNSYSDFGIDDICFTKITPPVPCACGTYSDMSYRPYQGAPNISIACNDSLIADCQAPINWTLGGNFMCQGSNCAPTTQMYWTLNGPAGSAPRNGSMIASPGFSISFPPYYFGVAGQYQLNLLAICGADTCRCNFTINATCPPCADCAFNIVQNPGFFDGAIAGEIGGSGSTNNWSAAAGTPDLSSGIYCCDPYAVQMWGSQDQGEAICQPVTFTAGKTYTVRFYAHYYPAPGLTTTDVQFGFYASNGCVDPFSSSGSYVPIGISAPISSPGCVLITLPNWTPGINYNTLIIKALNGSNYPNISFGRIDDICIQECDSIRLRDSLVGYFPFNNLSGTVSQQNIEDVSGLGIDGTGSNIATQIFSTGHFNGVSTGVDCTTDTRMVTTEVSLVAWVNTTETVNGQWVAGQYNFNADRGYGLAVGNNINGNIGQVAFGGRDGSGAYHSSGYGTNPPLVNNGEWHCLVGTAGSNIWSVYVDGNQTSSAAGSTTGGILLGTSNQPFTIGWLANSNTPLWFNGDIDDVRIYNRVLTICEVDSVCSNSYVSDVLNLPDLSTLRIYPNPNPGTFTVELPSVAQSGMSFRIIDLTGRLVQENRTETGSTKQTIQAGDLPNGLYFLQVVAEGRVLAVEKFVKQ